MSESPVPPPSRMLILDYALSSEAVVEGVAWPFARAGGAAQTRLHYPNLVGDDVSRYGTIALLAGRTPEFPSARVSGDEAALAAGFVRAGGLLILAPNLDGGEGAHERQLFNRLLADLEVPIRILDGQVEDDVNRYTACMWDRPFYAPVAGHPVTADAPERLPFDRSCPLAAGPGVDVPLTTFETARPTGRMPAVVVGRAGAGTVVVAGRYLLDAVGIPLRLSGEPLVHPEWLDDTAAWLRRLAAHLLGLATGDVAWAPVNPCADGWHASATDARAAEAADAAEEDGTPVGPEASGIGAPVLDHVPEGVRTLDLAPPAGAPHDFDRDLASRYEQLPDEARYGWIRRHGVRASWGRTVEPDPAAFTRDEVGQVGRALAGCGINLFWGISNCQAMAGHAYSDAERASVTERWAWTAEALDGTDVKWYPTLDYRYFRDEQTRCLGAQGQLLEAPSPLDQAFWRLGWREPLCAIAEYSLRHDCIGGIGLDVELYAHPPAYNYYSGYGFEDLSFGFGLDRLDGWVDAGLLREARDLPQTERFGWLRTHGLLEAYFEALSSEVERACRQVRDAVWTVNPDLLFASYIFTTPCNWFDIGLYRGLSTPERPVILMTFNMKSGRMLQHLRRQRVYAYHASVALLGMIGRDDCQTVFANSFRLGHGYWMNNINALLAGDPHSCESPALQGMSPEAAVRVIGAASAATGPGA